MKTVRLTLFTTSLTLLILAVATYWLLTPCHPYCTPGILQPFMQTFETHSAQPEYPSYHPKPDNAWPAPFEGHYAPAFIRPTFTPGHVPPDR